jgi:hypothetical protein
VTAIMPAHPVHPAHRAHVPRYTPAPPPVPRDPAAPGHRWPDSWPLRSYLELAALDTAPGSARAHAGAVLWEWNLAGIRDEAALIVSELVTNAMLSTQAAPLPARAPVRMWMLGSAGASVLFLVWDATEPAPVRRVTTPDAEHGRGLTLVDALSARWGYYHPADRPYGKAVWAVLPVAPLASGDPAARFMPLAPAWPENEQPRPSRVRPRGATPRAPMPPAKGAPPMFDSLTDETLRAAQDAARLLYDNQRALGLDPLAIKLDTLRVDITVELENRATSSKPATPAADDTRAGK